MLQLFLSLVLFGRSREHRRASWRAQQHRRRRPRHRVDHHHGAGRREGGVLYNCRRRLVEVWGRHLGDLGFHGLKPRLLLLLRTTLVVVVAVCDGWRRHALWRRVHLHPRLWRVHGSLLLLMMVMLLLLLLL